MTLVDTPVISAEYRAKAVAKVAELSPTVDADAAVDAALAWLAGPREGYPGDLADAGWHGLILASTRSYEELCIRVAGWFVHHEATGSDCRGCRHDPCVEPSS